MFVGQLQFIDAKKKLRIFLKYEIIHCATTEKKTRSVSHRTLIDSKQHSRHEGRRVTMKQENENNPALLQVAKEQCRCGQATNDAADNHKDQKNEGRAANANGQDDGQTDGADQSDKKVFAMLTMIVVLMMLLGPMMMIVGMMMTLMMMMMMMTLSMLKVKLMRMMILMMMMMMMMILCMMMMTEVKMIHMWPWGWCSWPCDDDFQNDGENKPHVDGDGDGHVEEDGSDVFMMGFTMMKKTTRKAMMNVMSTMMRMDTRYVVHEHDDEDDDGDDDGSAGDDNTAHAMLTIIRTRTVLTMIRLMMMMRMIRMVTAIAIWQESR